MRDTSTPRAVLRPPERWTGRDDGPGPEHARWHSVIRPWVPDERAVGGAVILGFASDEGVRRNGGRIGAAAGPPALRAALASLATPVLELRDGGDVLVGEDLEGGQVLLGEQVAAVLSAGGLPVVLGGGHEVAFGSNLGWSATLDCGRAAERWGILNVDAHFDLRGAPVPTSGTPFLQAARAEEAAGREFRYAVVGISWANNTRALFDRAAALGVPFLDDDAASRPAAVAEFVGGWLAGVDRVHLTLDLDALPAAVAPGVSAPAGFGIPLDAVRTVVRAVAASGKLGLLEVAELNPRHDIDGRTARTAARLVDEALRSLP
ncbi:MAG: formimidoylglutamase [Actinomycetes bacterium]|nr:formimidoylglutamase [Actinomycetes bacterium]